MVTSSTKRTSPHRGGFTLLEILLVIAAIAILAGIVIVAINPARQLAETRDAQREADVNTISSAITQYAIKNTDFPGLTQAETCSDAAYDAELYGICATGESCDGVSLDSYLIPDYVAAIPTDPSAEDGDVFSGYTAIELANGRLLVCAPLTERAEETISVTR